MENDFGFVSCIHAASAFMNPEVKPLSSEDLDTAIGFECDEFQVDDLLEFSNEIIGGQITATHLSDQSSDSAVNATGCQHLSEKHGELLHKAKEPEQEANDHCLEDEFSGLESLTNLGCCTNEQLKVDYNQELLINLDTMMVLEIGGAVTSDQFQMTSPVSVLESSATSGTVNSLSCWENQPSFPGRARSKRSRLGSKMWSLPVMTSSSSSQESGTSYTDSLSSLCLGANQKPPKPRQRMRLLREGLGTRKCAHCLSEKTPQWRAGPGGPKTLCNACGVRFKSGRLFPEYRPALSPTFESHIHSNSHRKVLDMRRHKEMEWIQQQQLMNLCHLQP